MMVILARGKLYMMFWKVEVYLSLSRKLLFFLFTYLHVYMLRLSLGSTVQTYQGDRMVSLKHFFHRQAYFSI